VKALVKGGKCKQVNIPAIGSDMGQPNQTLKLTRLSAGKTDAALANKAIIISVERSLSRRAA